jgi:hypothetical protein
MMTMGEFRELTGDVPDEWPIELALEDETDHFRFADADASVDMTSQRVQICDPGTLRTAPATG